MKSTWALLWKEWKGLRGIRWAGLALGLVVPLGFVAGAQAARDGGWVGSRAVSWTPQALLLDLLPATLALAIWPLVALLVAAQAFAGDKAIGAESFLLERPVSRGRVFMARLLASYGSMFVTLAGTAVIAAGLAKLATSGTPDAWRRAGLFMLGGVGISVLVLMCGATAAVLLKSPMIAVLLGGLLAALPLLLSLQLGSGHPAATWGMLPVGMAWPWLLLPTYVIAAVVGACLGEPMGRGRTRRIAWILGGSLVVIFGGFAVSAPLAMRSRASAGAYELDVVMPKAGDAILVRTAGFASTSGGWIIDRKRGTRVRFLAPVSGFVAEAAWKPDGSRLARLSDAGTLGAIGKDLHLEFYGADGASIGSPIALPGVESVETIAWCGDRVAMTAFLGTNETRLLFIDPASGTIEPSSFRRGGRTRVFLFGPTDDGSIWLRAFRFASPGAKDVVVPANAEPRAIELYRVDPATRKVSAEPLLVEDRWITWWFQGRISRSGRYWVRERAGDDGKAVREVIELLTGTVVPLPRPTRNLFWLSGDQLAWTETAHDVSVLMIAKVGEAGHPLRAWKDAHVGLLPAPGGATLLTHVLSQTSGGPQSTSWEMGEDDVEVLPPVTAYESLPSNAAYAVNEDRWFDTGHLYDDRPHVRSVWAGPNEFLRFSPGAAEIVRVDKPGERHPLWGTVGASD